jgi:peptidoglycan/LPS O-acetylase OafA/YrhL
LFNFADILHGSSTRWQTPFLVRVAVVFLSLFLAYLTYKYVEQPIRSSPYTSRTAIILSLTMAACIVSAYLFLIRG